MAVGVASRGLTTTAIHQAVHSTHFGQVPLVTGLTDDLVLVDGGLESVSTGLALELRRLYHDILVVTYDLISGLHAEDHSQAADLRTLYSDTRETWPQGLPGQPPEIPAGHHLDDLPVGQSAMAIAGLVRQSLRPVAVVIDHADLILTRAMAREEGRQVIGALRGAIARRGRTAATDVQNPLLLVAGDATTLDGGLTTHPLVQRVVIVPPTLEERAVILERLELSHEVANLASGISRRRLLTLKPISEALVDATASRIVRVAVNGMPRRPWSAQDRQRIRDDVAPDVRRALPGQEAVVDQVCAALAVAGLPRIRAAGPRDVFLLAGPPAVGKTELTRQLATAMFGDVGAIRRFDMTEYMESHSRAKLIGAPPGYVGFEGGGQLTDWVRANPDSIVLLDELEKAHEDVLLLLLQILEDGRLTDGRGLTVDFTGIVLFMTTNMGSATAIEELTAEGADPHAAMLAKRVTELIRDTLRAPRRPDGSGGLGRPELWSRLQGAVMPFDVVRRANIERIVARLLADFTETNAEADYRLEFDTAAVGALIADHPELAGAEGTWDTRTILKLLREHVESPVRHELSRRGEGATLSVGVDRDARKVVFDRGSA